MTRREIDRQRALDALALGVSAAARLHRVSEITIRRARRDVAESTAARALLALLNPPNPPDKGTNQ